MTRPSIPKGTRDFSPEEMLKREFIFDTIRRVFRLYGYQPIETPAMESLSTLLGKYGEEGDKLLFRILNSGDFLSDVKEEDLLKRDQGKISSKISEKGLRYDLTVPFARYVVQHRDEIVFPFKRYQMQPVWRADRPQKGRYREFFQCDVDVIGSDSLLNEYELIKIIDEIFCRLGISVVVKVNNRKVLTGIAETAGVSDKVTDITVAIDKIEKIGIDAVIEELKGKGISDKAITKLKPVLDLKGNTKEKFSALEKMLAVSEAGKQGIAELKTLFGYVERGCIKSPVELDLTLARGLNYYTGAIIEVKSVDFEIGSVCGGGRYDDLTGIFGMAGVSGVGVSFGADRIYDVLAGLNRFGTLKVNDKSVMVINFGEKELSYNLNILYVIQKLGITAEIFPEAAKMKKQLAYANSKKITYVVIAGEDEIKNNEVTFRNMVSGDQKKIGLDDLVSFLEEWMKEK
jgi:histidyl-tRNA synthetase